MNARTFFSASLLAVVTLLYAPVPAAETQKPVLLLTPRVTGGKPLMQTLRDRSSSRSFKGDKLPLQVLSDLLWAAFGINRPESGKRTAPSAMNWQEIDVYVALSDGLYLYDAKTNVLTPVIARDIRGLTGLQDFVKEAPLNLVYVADLSRVIKADGEDRVIYTAADAGFISQNVCLFCASEGLATVVRGSLDRQALARAMNLRPDQRIILAQTVGYPK